MAYFGEHQCVADVEVVTVSEFSPPVREINKRLLGCLFDHGSHCNG